MHIFAIILLNSNLTKTQYLCFGLFNSKSCVNNNSFWQNSTVNALVFLAITFSKQTLYWFFVSKKITQTNMPGKTQYSTTQWNSPQSKDTNQKMLCKWTSMLIVTALTMPGDVIWLWDLAISVPQTVWWLHSCHGYWQIT